MCSNMENMNDTKYLNDHVSILLQQLESLEAVPGLQIESGLHPKVCIFTKKLCVDSGPREDGERGGAESG